MHRPRSAAARSSSEPSRPGDRRSDRLQTGFRPVSEADWRRCLGRRVTLRYRLRDESEHPFSEALGTLQSVTPGEGGVQISLVNRRGELLTLDLEDVENAKLM